MNRYHDVRQLTTVELERAKRDLQANLGLITSHSAAHVPIQAQMRAIDFELAKRVENQRVNESNQQSPLGSPCRATSTEQN